MAVSVAFIYNTANGRNLHTGSCYTLRPWYRKFLGQPSVIGPSREPVVPYTAPQSLLSSYQNLVNGTHDPLGWSEF